MSALVMTELLKLRLTRTTWWFLAVALLLGAARTAGVLVSVGTAAGLRRGTAEATMTLAGAPGAGLLVLLLLAVVCVTGEHRHGTMTGSVLQVPDRRRLVVAKCLAMALAGTVLGLVLLVMGLAVAFLTGVGGPLSVGDLLVLVVALVTVAVFWSWLGVGIGLLVTNQTVAVLVPVLWLVVVEPLVGSSGLPGVLPWLPASLPGQVLPSSPGGPGPALAVVLLAAYGLALSVPGTFRLVRRDLT